MEIVIQETTFEHKENLIMRVVEYWKRLPRDYGVSVLGDSENIITHDPGKPTVAGLLLSTR